MRKVQGRARVPLVPEQSSLGWVARVAEQRSSGYGEATPPGSFTDCFFNGSTGQSPGKNATPPGGFTNFIQPNLFQQFNFVGEPSPDNTYVNVDSGDKAPRTEKRIFWTQDEDVRMMSSWLLNSADSTIGTIGADRKNDQYWTDAIKYNEKLNLDCFVLMEVWNTVKIEAKWITYNNRLKAARKRKSSGREEKEGDDSSHIDEDQLDKQPRPMEQKAAKKLKYAKSKEVDHINLEELDNFGKIQCEEHANRLKVLEVQQNLSFEKIEQAKLAHLAAKEQKETRIFDIYNRLLLMDVSLMSIEEKLDHANTMRCLKKKLFANN
ncbi:hypothetical protein PVAP13_2NG358015 [Panicum virgatum]|uniref:No apical meristem-associated C-terminal domain-containing protein n=1 Tax=Panicum virgatum TaxID=38727 RepID=A0A8T0VKV7_PANVG|nr:hypothetical protein PVAP13_2NG358015 [Panicum virgatum]